MLRRLPAFLLLTLVAAACASSGGTRSEPVENPRVYVADVPTLSEASADALRRLRMEIIQAEEMADGNYMLVGRFANANTRSGSGGDSQMIRLQVTIEPLGPAQTRVLVEAARSGSYGGSQSARFTEDFFELLESQGFTPLRG